MATKTSLFVEHPAIKPLANYQRWTVTEPDTKRPIDIPWMWATAPDCQIRGCDYRLPDTMLTLPKLVEMTTADGQEVMNFAYYLTPDLDDIIVVDVEPTATNEVKEAFLNTPFIYGETSMSGRGFHLIYPKPKHLFDKYPISQTKSRLRSEDKTFEILIEHWVTFTGNQVKPPAMPRNTLESLVESLFANATESPTESTLSVSEDAPESVTTWMYTEFAPIILRQAASNAPTLEECHQDMSEYEARYVTYLIRQFNQIMKAYNTRIPEPYIPTDDEVVYFAALLAEEMLDWREKHERIFNGHKWLIQKAIEGLEFCMAAPQPWKWTY